MVRPNNSYHPNLIYHNAGIWHTNGLDSDEQWSLMTFDTILKENGHESRSITYLKMDVEGSELFCFNNWFKSNVFSQVKQFGIEFHLQSNILKPKLNSWYQKLYKYVKRLQMDYDMQIIASDPNLCLGKSEDVEKKHYAYIDLLMVNSGSEQCL